VNNEKKYIKRIVEKIRKFSADVVLVEKSVNRMATELLLECNMTVVQNI
jgi:hypothetical protein